MPQDIISGSTQVYKVFSAVFSQKPNVSANRVAILESISKSAKGKMKFRDILKDIQAEMQDIDYTSERLTYDLRVLRRHDLINKTWDGEYTITENGTSILAMYREMIKRVSAPKRRGKTGFVGEVNGQIKAKDFDFNHLGEELTRLSFFRKRFIASKERFCLEWKDDDDDFTSEIEIREKGHFSIRVVLYRGDVHFNHFLSDFDESEEWYETARSISQTIVYYIKRTVRKFWKDAEIDVPWKPDSYPI